MATSKVFDNFVDFGDNPYLTGPHEPVRKEITESTLECIGEIPKDFSGIYLRNGPNQRFQPYGSYHWFDGDGMVHSAHFEDGKVSYKNRWVTTKAFEIESNKK